MNNNMENKTDKTLSSIDGIERAKANPFLYGKIMSKLKANHMEVIYTGKMVFKVAAMVVFILSLNLVSIVHRKKISSQKVKASIEEFAKEYSIDNYNFDNY